MLIAKEEAGALFFPLFYSVLHDTRYETRYSINLAVLREHKMKRELLKKFINEQGIVLNKFELLSVGLVELLPKNFLKKVASNPEMGEYRSIAKHFLEKNHKTARRC